MANNNESTMKWKVDVTQLKAAMQEAKRAINQANAEFKTATAGMDKWSKSSEGLEAKLQQLNKTLPAQKRQLEVLEAQYSDTVKKMGENSSAAADLKIKIEEQKATITKTETSIEKYNGQLSDMKAKQAESESATGKLSKTIQDQESDLVDLKKAYANATLEYGENSDEAKNLAKQISDLSGELADNKKKLDDAEKSADEFDKSIDEAGESAKEAANGGFTVLKGAMANLVAEGINKAVEGLKQLAGKIVEVGKQSIGEYANYEQLVGGVETLFKDSAKIVEGYADNAYKTAGLSANEYMETVTSFSASLLQGLNGDTAKAAKIADMAITDMSDNANKMGSDMASLQNAYQGFAKGNYTMLDNLKLGYGGTKTEMLRLVKDAGVVNDSVESIDDVSFDKIIEAIHIIQDEMGVTGTTSKEAATTIEGSKNSMSASWKNLLKEMAKDNGDIEGSFNEFAGSMITYGKNLLPRVKQLVGNVVDFASKELRKRFPEMMKAFDFIVDVVKQIFGAVKTVFDFVKNNGAAVIATITGIATAVGVYLAYSTALKIMTQGWKSLAIVQKVVAAGQAALNTVMAMNPIGLIVAAIAGLIAAFVILWNKSEAFRNFFINLWENIKQFVGTAVEAISGFFSGLWDGIKSIWETVSGWFDENVIQPVVGFFSGLWETVSGFFVGLWEDIKEIWNTVSTWFDENVIQPLIGFFTGLWEGIVNAFHTVIDPWIEIAKRAFLIFKTDIIDPLLQFFTDLWNKIKEAANNAWEFIKGVWIAVSTWFNDNIIQPVINFFVNLWNTISTGASNAWQGIKNIWSAVSNWFNEKIIMPVKNFFKGMWDGLKSGAKDAWQGIKNVFGKVKDWFKDKFSAAWKAVKDVFSTGGKVFDGIKEGITNAFKTVVNAIIKGINKVVSIPFNAINKVLDKLRNLTILGVSPFSWLGSIGVPQIPLLAQGGVLKRGQIGLLEGNGAEAVVPLERNKKWIAAVVKGMIEEMNINGLKGAMGNQLATMTGRTGSVENMTQNVTFNQTINSPKAVDRLTLYRETNSLLFSAKVRMANV